MNEGENPHFGPPYKRLYTGDSIRYPGEEEIKRIANGVSVVLSLKEQKRLNVEAGTIFTVVDSSMHDGQINYTIHNEKGDKFVVSHYDIEVDPREE